MKVKLIDYTQNPLEVLAKATLVSYWDEWSVDNLDKITVEDAKKHLPEVLKHGHDSVLEHIKMTWAIEGISRVVSHQLVRHRLASYTQRSQRFCREDFYEKKNELYHTSSYGGDGPHIVEVRHPKPMGKVFVIPDSFKEAKFSIKKNDWYEVDAFGDDEYLEVTGEDMFKRLAVDLIGLYEDLVDKGVPQEEARYVLPQAIRTSIVVTMNMREFKHFIGLRLCERAQPEMRELAKRMWRTIYEVEGLRPIIEWAKIGPRCVQLGYCPEGDLMPERCLRRQKDWWNSTWRRID